MTLEFMISAMQNAGTPCLQLLWNATLTVNVIDFDLNRFNELPQIVGGPFTGRRSKCRPNKWEPNGSAGARGRGTA